MIDSIYRLLSSHQDDFWLNVLASLPFLVFDVAIITMLLPITLRWWDERTWRETRIMALRRLFRSYADIRLGIGNDDEITALGEQPPIGIEVCDAADKMAIKRASQILAGLHEYSERIDLEIQTSLGLLNATMVKDILNLHYLVKEYVDGLIYQSECFMRQYDCGDMVKMRGTRDGETLSNYYCRWIHGRNFTSLLSVCKAYQKLRVGYSENIDELNSYRRSIPAEFLSPMAHLVSIGAYFDRSEGFIGVPYGAGQAFGLYAAIANKLRDEVPVSPYFVKRSGMLIGRIYSEILDKPPSSDYGFDHGL